MVDNHELVLSTHPWNVPRIPKIVRSKIKYHGLKIKVIRRAPRDLEILLMTLIYRTITIVGSSSLTAGNIKNGVWIFGVKGTFTGWVDSTMPMSVITGSNTLRVDGSASSSQGDSFSAHWAFANMGTILNAGFNWVHVDAHGYVDVGDSTSSGNAYMQIQTAHDESDGSRHWTRYSIGDRDWYRLDGDGGTRSYDKRSSFDMPLRYPSYGWWLAWILVFFEVPKRYMWGYCEITNAWFYK